MRYDNPELQDLLASEYVVGSLRGAARRRMTVLMHRHAGLRQRVAQWEEHMYPMFARAPAEKAPDRIWRKVQQRVFARHSDAGRVRKAWWSGFLSAGALATLVAAALIMLLPLREPPPTYVAVLSDGQARASVLATWSAKPAARRQIALRILTHPSMPPDTAWEAWWIPAEPGPPLSLGLVSTTLEQVLHISEAAAAAMPRPGSIGVTVEPKGGSPTGRPSAGYLFLGAVARVGG
jgi:anti-sigma-K factor RskA